MAILADTVEAMYGEEPPIEVSLVELVVVLSEITEDENEIFATIDHMIEHGRVKILPSLGTKIPEAA